MADIRCVTSTYAIQPAGVSYVDIRPHASSHDRLSGQVLQIPITQLLASKALQQHALVLIDNPRTDDSKNAICTDLKKAGYTNIRFLRESAPDLTWRHDKPALKTLPAHGWQVIAAADVHQMLGEVSYRPVYITMGKAELLAPEGFEVVENIEGLLRLIASGDERQLVVFPPDSSTQPLAHNMHTKRNLWWVADGVTGFRTHQTTIMQAFLQRTNRYRLCE